MVKGEFRMSNMNQNCRRIKVGGKVWLKVKQENSKRGLENRKGYVHPPNGLWVKLLNGKQDT